MHKKDSRESRKRSTGYGMGTLPSPSPTPAHPYLLQLHPQGQRPLLCSHAMHGHTKQELGNARTSGHDVLPAHIDTLRNFEPCSNSFVVDGGDPRYKLEDNGRLEANLSASPCDQPLIRWRPPGGGGRRQPRCKSELLTCVALPSTLPAM